MLDMKVKWIGNVRFVTSIVNIFDLIWVNAIVASLDRVQNLVGKRIFSFSISHF